MTPEERRARRAAQRKSTRARARAEAARQREIRDEKIAPAAQRKPVTTADGALIKAPRLVRTGVGFVQASPIALLAASRPWITASKVRSVKRLEACWRLVGDGIGTASAAYSSVSAFGGTAPKAPPGHGALCAQLDAANELAAVQARLGPLYGIVRDVCFIGLDMTAWAATKRIDRKAVPGYLDAALDIIEDAYRVIDEAASKRRRNRRLRSGQAA